MGECQELRKMIIDIIRELAEKKVEPEQVAFLRAMIEAYEVLFVRN